MPNLRSRRAVEVTTAQAAAAVPAGRLGGNLHTDTMTLYAVISADAWTVLTHHRTADRPR
jgi:hypothetical protein